MPTERQSLSATDHHAMIAFIQQHGVVQTYRYVNYQFMEFTFQPPVLNLAHWHAGYDGAVCYFYQRDFPRNGGAAGLMNAGGRGVTIDVVNRTDLPSIMCVRAGEDRRAEFAAQIDDPNIILLMAENYWTTKKGE